MSINTVIISVPLTMLSNKLYKVTDILKIALRIYGLFQLCRKICVMLVEGTQGVTNGSSFNFAFKVISKLQRDGLDKVEY